MTRSTTVKGPADYLLMLVSLILALLPFHAFITVWVSSNVGHYTILRLWKELLFIPVLAGALYFLVIDKKLRQKIWAFWPARLIAVYSLLLLSWAFIALAAGNVTGKAMWYGLLVDLRFLIFFLAVWVLAAKSSWLANNWQRVLFAPAIIVAAFAILQYLVLPYDFLKHFGYSETTIFPYETINHNIEHLRVASTTRGANPLGAYLLLPISALAVLLIKEKRQRSDKLMIGFGLLLALAFSFSRSAWLGAVLSGLIIIWFLIKSQATKKLLLAVGGIFVVVALLGAIALRHNTTFENLVFHTDHTSKIDISSNEGHSAAFRIAMQDISNEPLGHGVGTAGPQSAYNDEHARIAENYYLQIGQEAGVLAIILFGAICFVVGKLLWERRADTLALWLLASLIGIAFINLLSHAWTDDTLAYIWWGLAAVALAPKLFKKNT